MLKIYLAGGLFNAGERLHNLFLEKHLKELGYQVILPQREASKFYDGKLFDIEGVRDDCATHSADLDKIVIGNLDGPDTDSGTAVEIAIAINATGRAVIYRTDFRTDPENELGVNAMLRLKGTRFIYYPCFFTELDQVNGYYQKLANLIHDSIKLVSKGGYNELLVKQKNA